MSALVYLTIFLSGLWLISEVVVSIIKRSTAGAKRQDRLSYLLIWLSFFISIQAAVNLKLYVPFVRKVGSITLLAPFLGYCGCVIIVAGLVIRWIAILTLGNLFTVQVVIAKYHRVIDHGIYRTLRHPSYLGSLICFLGAGLAIENWLCLIVLVVLPLSAFIYRISVEERTLLRVRP